MEKIKIGNKLIGKGEPCFIIAEAGVNHQGSLKLAKKLIDVAKDARADAVKFQTFLAKEAVVKNAKPIEYQRKNIGGKETQLEMIKKFELGYKSFKELKRYADKKRIIFLSTPDPPRDAKFLENLVPAHKIGSAELLNYPLLKEVAKKKKPIILSTGMATLAEVKKALKFLKKSGSNKIILLHCTTNYPCPLNEVNLRAMETMRKKLGCLVGYSDHTLGITVPVLAAVLGARVLEKHFTLSKNLPGPDHKASLEPQELKEMVKAVREIEKLSAKDKQKKIKSIANFKEILGRSSKKPTKSELKIKKLYRRSIVGEQNIRKGELITPKNIALKRPGLGLPSEFYKKIIGKTAKTDIKKGEFIRLNKLK